MKVSSLLSKYSPQEFSAIADFLEQTTEVLSEEAKRLQEASG